MILVFGRNGQLAKSLKELYKKDDIFFSSSGDLDLLNTKEIISKLSNLNKLNNISKICIRGELMMQKSTFE